MRDLLKVISELWIKIFSVWVAIEIWNYPITEIQALKLILGCGFVLYIFYVFEERS